MGLIDFSRGKMAGAGESLLSLDEFQHYVQLDLQVPERYLAKLSLEEVEAKKPWPG